MFLFERTNKRYDIDRVLLEWEYLSEKVKWYRKAGPQTALQYVEGNTCPYTDPCGSWTYRLMNGEGTMLATPRTPVKTEHDIAKTVPDYEGTIFEEIMNDWDAYRMRVLCRKKQTTYTVHTDVTPFRYHLALITNPDAYVVYPTHKKLFQIPADGYVYRMNTTEPHTVMNCGPDRYHLVWGSITKEKEYENECAEIKLRYAGY